MSLNERRFPALLVISSLTRRISSFVELTLAMALALKVGRCTGIFTWWSTAVKSFDFVHVLRRLSEKVLPLGM